MNKGHINSSASSGCQISTHTERYTIAPTRYETVIGLLPFSSVLQWFSRISLHCSSMHTMGSGWRKLMVWFEAYLMIWKFPKMGVPQIIQNPSLAKPQMWQETIGLTHPIEVFLPVLLSTSDRFSLSMMGCSPVFSVISIRPESGLHICLYVYIYIYIFLFQGSDLRDLIKISVSIIPSISFYIRPNPSSPGWTPLCCPALWRLLAMRTVSALRYGCEQLKPSGEIQATGAWPMVAMWGVGSFGRVRIYIYIYIHRERERETEREIEILHI